MVELQEYTPKNQNEVFHNVAQGSRPWRFALVINQQNICSYCIYSIDVTLLSMQCINSM